MPGAFSIVPALILAAVLIASAIAKLRHPDDLHGWTQMGVPRLLRRRWLLRFHPWGEMLLGLALVVLGGVLGLLAALAGVALMAAYTWLVWRTWNANRKAAGGGDDAEAASCACFGQQRPVTALTLVRNVWLLTVAIAAASGTWSNPLLGGPLASATAEEVWVWIVGLAAAAVTALLIVWPDGSPVPAAPRPSGSRTASDGDLLDYIRTRTPAVPVTQADGTVVNLRTLASERPILLLAVSEICGACMSVIERIPEWREFLPEVDIRILSTLLPEASRLTEREEPQSLHDPNEYVSGSIEDWRTPTAVLFGIDGMLAGGPVTGTDDVMAFVSEVHDNLHGEPPTA